MSMIDYVSFVCLCVPRETTVQMMVGTKGAIKSTGKAEKEEKKEKKDAYHNCPRRGACSYTCDVGFRFILIGRLLRCVCYCSVTVLYFI